ncbi:diadenylate cyclase CdaA [candidate division NPL-UPA2 bacterium]|nr:diadenylate cyclase CdaA [candidate division NPL-UPA2 bacterium]
MLEFLFSIRWLDILRFIVEVFIISFFFYKIWLFIRGTRAVHVMKALVLLIVAAFLANVFKLHTLTLIVRYLMPVSVIAFIILFQPELRRGLARLGENPLFGSPWKEEVIEEMVKSANFLSRKKVGALIALERDIGLRNYAETGVEMDSRVSSELLNSIFMPNTPLHDGAVIIQGDRIAAAGAILPLAEAADSVKTIGTRHLAAMGLTEETDAVVVVVSEETGAISAGIGGKLTRDLDGATLQKFLLKVYSSRQKKRTSIRRRDIKGEVKVANEKAVIQ